MKTRGVKLYNKFDENKDKQFSRHGKFKVSKMSKNSAEIQTKLATQDDELKVKQKKQKRKQSSNGSPSIEFVCKVCDVSFSSEVLYNRHQRNKHVSLELDELKCQISADHLSAQCDRTDNASGESVSSVVLHDLQSYTCDAKLDNHVTSPDKSTSPVIAIEKGTEHEGTTGSEAYDSNSNTTVGNNENGEKLDHTEEGEITPEIITFSNTYKNMNSGPNLMSTGSPSSVSLSCKECEKTFSTKHSLLRHKKTFHDIEKSFKCDLCPKAYAQKVSLEYHTQSHNSEPIVCDQCGSVLKNKGSLEYHIRTQHMNNKFFRCEFCDKKFRSKKSLKNHQILHLKESLDKTLSEIEVGVCEDEGKIVNQCLDPESLESELKSFAESQLTDEKIYCKLCDKVFATRNCLSKHQSNIHDGYRPFKCSICSKTYPEKYGLECHMETHAGQKQCSICGAMLKSKGSLYAHMRSQHKNKKTFNCDMCDVVLSSKTSLEHHKRIHSGEKPYICQTCGTAFRLKNTLIQHQSVHAENKPHKCDICQKSFTRKQHLKMHMLVHSADKTFTCDICGDCFLTKSYLQRHQLSHKEDRPYSCEVCGSKYKTRSILRAHSFIHKAKSFHCKECGKSFSQRNGLQAHMKFHFGIRTFVCDICGKSYGNSNHLNEHKRRHTGEKPFVCDICGKFFRHSSGLKSHIRLHSDARPYKCGICSKTYRSSGHLAEHKRTHTGQKPFKCNICNKGFARNKNLLRHRKIHIGVSPSNSSTNDIKREGSPKSASDVLIKTLDGENGASECSPVENSVIVTSSDNSECQVQCFEIGSEEESIIMIVYPEKNGCDDSNLTLTVEGDDTCSNYLQFGDGTILVQSQNVKSEEIIPEVFQELDIQTNNSEDPEISNSALTIGQSHLEDTVTSREIGDSHVIRDENIQPELTDNNTSENDHQTSTDNAVQKSNCEVDSTQKSTVIILKEQNCPESQMTEAGLDNSEVADLNSKDLKQKDEHRQTEYVQELEEDPNPVEINYLSVEGVTDEDFSAAACLSSILQTSLSKYEYMKNSPQYCTGGSGNVEPSTVAASSDPDGPNKEGEVSQDTNAGNTQILIVEGSESFQDGNQGTSNCVSSNGGVESIMSSENLENDTEVENTVVICPPRNEQSNSDNVSTAITESECRPTTSDVVDDNVEKGHICETNNYEPENSDDAQNSKKSFAETESKCSIEEKLEDDDGDKDEDLLHSGVGQNNCGECNEVLNNNDAVPCNKSKRRTVNIFLCDLCGQTFKNKPTLETHRQSHSDEEKEFFKCHHCDKLFSTKYCLKRHIDRLNKNKPHVCSICSKGYFERVHLVEHMAKYSDKRTFPCTMCSSAFKHKSSLSHHVSSKHKNSESFLCDICGREFSDQNGLRRHYPIHGNARRYSCKLCSKKFKQVSGLAKHVQTHSSDKPHMCDICSCSFRNRSQLNEHFRIHTGEKPYECSICRQKFRHTSGLNRHRLTHTEARPYRCDLCGSSFRSATNLGDHRRTHTGEKPYKCQQCGETFRRSVSLRKHMKTNHGPKSHTKDEKTEESIIILLHQ